MLHCNYALGRVALPALLSWALVAGTAAAQPRGADGGDEAGEASGDLDDRAQLDQAVAKALYERGLELYTRGEYAHAKQMFIESLERSPRGAVAGDALRMLRNANERLGVTDLDAGAPGEGDDPPADDPLDPYGPTDDPVDPYAPSDQDGKDGDAAGDEPRGDDSDAGDGLGPLDPYAAGGTGADDLIDDDDYRRARRDLMIGSGSYGLLAGLALLGPESDGELTGGAVLTGLLGAGAGVGLAYYLAGRYELTPGEARTISWGGAWGAYTFGLLGDVVTGVDSSTPNQIYRSAAIGGAVGTAAAVFMSREWSPSEDDVALTNSIGFYGTMSGLMLGVVMDPPTGEAYSLNGALGAAGGLGLGMYLSQRYDVSRDRMLRVDLGAAAGLAATWVLFYPLVADDTTNNDEQAAGVISLLAMAGGAYGAWYMTRDMAPASIAGEADEPPPPPALVRRSGDGRWDLGAPLPRPIESPALAPPTGRSFGLDVLGGHF